MENNKIDVICEKIFRRGISIGCNKMLKSIIKDYLNGNGENELKENLKNYAGLINRVYGTFKDIKTRASKKISPYFGRHYTELIENYNFTEGIIRYSLIINGSLEKKMFELVNSISEEQKSILKRKYKKEKKVDIHEILKTLSKDPGIYIFTIDNILKESEEKTTYSERHKSFPNKSTTK